MDNIKIDKLLLGISLEKYQMKTEDDFDNYSEFSEYRTLIVLMIDELKLITKPITNNREIYLTQLGLDIIEKGGWLKFRENEKNKSNFNLEKEKYDFLSKKWVYKTRFLPFILSFLALLLSALTFIMNFGKHNDTLIIQEDIKQLKSKIIFQDSIIRMQKNNERFMKNSVK